MPPTRLAPRPIRDIIGAAVAVACLFGPVVGALLLIHLITGR